MLRGNLLIIVIKFAIKKKVVIKLYAFVELFNAHLHTQHY